MRAATRTARLTENLALLDEAAAIMGHFGAAHALDAMREEIRSLIGGGDPMDTPEKDAKVERRGSDPRPAKEGTEAA